MVVAFSSKGLVRKRGVAADSAVGGATDSAAGGAADSATGDSLDEDAAVSSGGLDEDACDGDLDGSPRILLW